VLFIGNSLTYTNDLPRTVADLAASGGVTVRVASATGPDLALIDHLHGATNALAQLRLGGWQYVLLQQGPSTLPVNQDSLTLWTRMFDPYIRAGGARPALLMVWPSSDRLAFFDDVRLSYQNAAKAVGGMFIPAGQARREAWSTDPSLAFFSGDGFHPSPLGTYAAALVIYERVTGNDARQLPPRAVVAGQDLGLPDSTVRLLQNAAHAANERFAP
jgi:hypothetical protein